MGGSKYQHWRKFLSVKEMNTLRVGMMLYFSTNKLADPTNDEPHYLVIVAIDGSTVYFLCFQSSERSANNQVKGGKDSSTILYIKNTPENGLKKVSYLDCNHSIDYSLSELTAMCQQKKIQVKGDISLADYYQIKYGILESDVNDLPEEVLIHPED